MDKDIQIMRYLILGMCILGIGVIGTLLLTQIFSGIPMQTQNNEFKETFCETQGFDKYEDETCIKFNNGTATIKQIHCEGQPQSGFIIFDGMYKKLIKCRLVA